MGATNGYTATEAPKLRMLLLRTAVRHKHAPLCPAVGHVYHIGSTIRSRRGRPGNRCLRLPVQRVVPAV